MKGVLTMKGTLLVVDDEREFARMLAERLQLKGYTADACFDGVEALNRVKANDYDVIILDVIMPEPDGIATLEKIKKYNPIIEVIMLSGQATLEVAVAGLKRGAFEYLKKPCDDRIMVTKINEALKRKQDQEERIRLAIEDVKTITRIHS
jgi:DNA-binding NtrC family response regulator